MKDEKVSREAIKGLLNSISPTDFDELSFEAHSELKPEHNAEIATDRELDVEQDNSNKDSVIALRQITTASKIYPERNVRHSRLDRHANKGELESQGQVKGELESDGLGQDQGKGNNIDMNKLELESEDSNLVYIQSRRSARKVGAAVVSAAASIAILAAVGIGSRKETTSASISSSTVSSSTSFITPDKYASTTSLPAKVNLGEFKYSESVIVHAYTTAAIFDKQAPESYSVQLYDVIKDTPVSNRFVETGLSLVTAMQSSTDGAIYAVGKTEHLDADSGVALGESEFRVRRVERDGSATTVLQGMSYPSDPVTGQELESVSTSIPGHKILLTITDSDRQQMLFKLIDANTKEIHDIDTSKLGLKGTERISKAMLTAPGNEVIFLIESERNLVRLMSLKLSDSDKPHVFVGNTTSPRQIFSWESNVKEATQSYFLKPTAASYFGSSPCALAINNLDVVCAYITGPSEEHILSNPKTLPKSISSWISYREGQESATLGVIGPDIVSPDIVGQLNQLVLPSPSGLGRIDLVSEDTISLLTASKGKYAVTLPGQTGILDQVRGRVPTETIEVGGIVTGFTKYYSYSCTLSDPNDQGSRCKNNKPELLRLFW